jgi:hypothetical protein
MSAGVRFVVSVYDRRGQGMRRAFGSFTRSERAQEVADKINNAAAKPSAPRAHGADQAIRAYVAFLYPRSEATVRNCVTDAPHPDTFKRPSEERTEA